MNSFSREKIRLMKMRGTGIFPKSLFIVFALVGAIIIWNLKRLGFSQTITAFTPVLFIISYCSIAYYSRLFYITEERIGDNAYYLGFLYTLSSLSYALHVFTLDESASEQMITSFSVALWSTIAGIAARVFLSQLRQDPNDIEKEARIKIADTANHLASELHQSAILFNTYRKSIEQTMTEAFDRINKEAEGAVTANVEKLVSNTNTISENLNNRFLALNENSKKLNIATSNIAISMEKLDSRINSVFSGIETSSEVINDISSRQTKLVETVSQEFTNLVLNTKVLNEQLSTLKDQTRNLLKATDDGKDFVNKISGYADSMEAIASRQQQIINTISNHANKLRDELERSRGYTNEVHQSFVNMTKSLTEKLGSE
jgi:peptide methionine sulfoxide reductase MsrA